MTSFDAETDLKPIIIMCLTKRHYLHGSARADVREIWANSSAQHVETDN